MEITNEEYEQAKKDLFGEDYKIKKVVLNHYSKKDLIKEIWEIKPYFYDRNGLWWLWNNKMFKWEVVDEKDLLNLIEDNSDANTINSKEKNEILEAMSQFGRRKIPKEIKPTWVQFNDVIVDIATGGEIRASPEFFVTNPIPWTLNKEKFVETPVMDKIFTEWVGKENIKTLYQILAYCLIPDYPIHRIFCFIGSGLNGKSKFLDLISKFVGSDNVCCTELDVLLNSRFEVTRLHKKLVCQMGETNFNEMSKTSMLKKLSGGDLIGFEYKRKNPFEDKNYAKIIISTNNLPTTTDKTIGFYRRWMIVDFPNCFSEKKDILSEIPNEEYECLAVKSLIMLNDLLKEREFHKEGTIEQRMERYESKSDFLGRFIEQFTEESPNEHITSADFYKKFIAWSRENRFRDISETSVGMAMKKRGIEQERLYFNWLHDGKGGQIRCWVGIRWKN